MRYPVPRSKLPIISNITLSFTIIWRFATHQRAPMPIRSVFKVSYMSVLDEVRRERSSESRLQKVASVVKSSMATHNMLFTLSGHQATIESLSSAFLWGWSNIPFQTLNDGIFNPITETDCCYLHFFFLLYRWNHWLVNSIQLGSGSVIFHQA